MEKNKRRYYLDNIRWSTILLVVIFHIFFYYNNIGIAPMFQGVPEYQGRMTFGGIYQYLVYPWFMVLLFIVSGVSARIVLKKQTSRQFMKSRVDKILVPSTLGVLAFGWVGGYIIYLNNARPTMPEGTPGFVAVIISVLSGIGALWFCHVLFVAILVLMMIRFLIAKGKGTDDKVCQWVCNRTNSYLKLGLLLIILFLILWGGSHVLNMPVITSYRNGIYIPAFLMGYYVFSNETVVDRLKKMVLPMLLAGIVTGVIYIKNCYGMAYGDIAVLSRLDTNLYGFIVILFLLGAMARFCDKRNGLTDYMNRHSFGIYVFHIPVLLVTNYLLADSGWNMAAVYAVELVSALVWSIILYEIVSRIPILRYWILGIR